MYTVWCYQDRNGDGINQWPNDDGDLVYAEMRSPNEEITLGDGGSEWLWSGGDAECWAVLYAYGWKGGVESTRQLDSYGFHAEAETYPGWIEFEKTEGRPQMGPALHLFPGASSNP